MAGGKVVSGAVRNDPPDPDDWAWVVRPLGPFGPIIQGTSDLQNGNETPVSAVAVLVLPANPTRKSAFVQNVGGANIRIGTVGVTATTGIRLVPDGQFQSNDPEVVVNDIYAIREGAVDSIAFATEAI